jgi:2-polyprenyl-3-methyl-5-hydroxy-6-metoxy-1,4-benzoquinol methylase
MKKVKYYLSFFFEIALQRIESQQSGTLTISIHRGQLKLSTEKVIYSFGKNYSSFKYAFKKIKIEKLQVKNVLILGAGLGSIIQLLEPNPSVENIIAIDNDEIIIKAAKQYLKSDLLKKTTWINQDAFEYMEQNKKTFDLILFDVYIHEITPSIFMSESFLLLLKDSLSTNGILVFSKMDTNYKLRIENEIFSIQFASIFPKNEPYNFSGNRILVAHKN